MSKLLFTLMSALILLFSAAPGAHALVHTYNIIQLTEINGNDYYSPFINDNNYIAWKGYIRDSGDFYNEIFLHDGSTLIWSTDQVESNVNAIELNNSNHLMWNIDETAYIYDGETIKEIAGTYMFLPHFNDNDQITWESGEEIYFWDGSEAIQLTDNGTRDWYPDLNNNGQVVWSRSYNIWTYDGSEAKQLTTCSCAPLASPIINDSGQVVWSGHDGSYESNWNIYLYDPATDTPVNISNSEYHAFMDDLNENGHVVWAQRKTTDLDDLHPKRDIFYYDGTSAVNLTNSEYDMINPDINDNNYIVWSGFDGNDYEIYLYNQSSIQQITDNDYDDNDPSINNNNHIVWTAYPPTQYNDRIIVYAYPEIQDYTVDDLIALTTDLGLDTKVTDSYLKSLDQISNTIAAGRFENAIKKLNNFIDKVNRDISQGDITQAAANDLIEMTNAVIEYLEAQVNAL